MTHSYPNPSGTDGGNVADQGFSQPAYYETTAEPGLYDQASPAQGTDSGGAAQKAKDAASTAKDQAANVGQGAAQAGQQVAGVAKEQAAGVASEAAGQARDLLHQGRTEITTQASTQQQRIAAGLRSLGDELQSMGSSSSQQGAASHLVTQAAERTHGIASWLEDREPAQVLQEVQFFARQRPGAFLLLAAGVGLVGGRLTRGLVGAKHDESQAQNVGAQRSVPAPAYSADYQQSTYTPPVPPAADSGYYGGQGL